MTRPRIAATLVLIVAAAAFGGSSPEVPPVPAVVPASEAETKKHLEDVQKAVADKNDDLLVKALEEMQSFRSDAFVPFIRDGAKSANPTVLAAALRAAATHELKDMEKDVRKLLHAKPKKDAKDKDKDAKDPGIPGEVDAAAIDYLVRLGMSGEDETVVNDCLAALIAPMDDRRVSASWARDLLRAGVHYVGRYKVKRAVPLLVELVTPPEPKQATASSRGAAPPPGPPQAYWDARNRLWQASESWVRWALKEITGEEFRSGKEWEAWLKLNKKEFK
jgi:hypothetical protein